MKKRIGRFHVTATPENMELGLLAKVLAFMEFTPYRAEMLYHNNRMEYLGTSKLFEEIDSHIVPPFYEITPTIEVDDDDEWVILDVEVKEMPTNPHF